MSAGRKAKRCTGCGLEQPLDAFDRDPARRDGRASHCKGCRRVRQRAQGHPWARRRAQRWLARQHPQRWAERYQVRKREARAELPEETPRRAQSRAWSRALADVQAEFPEEYAARYQVELAAYRQQHGYIQPFAALSEKVDRRVLTQARARALEALAGEYLEQAERLAGPVLAGLLADASEETRAAARLLALDRLRALHPSSSRPATPPNSPVRSHGHDRHGRGGVWAGLPAADAGVDGPAQPRQPARGGGRPADLTTAFRVQAAGPRRGHAAGRQAARAGKRTATPPPTRPGSYQAQGKELGMPTTTTIRPPTHHEHDEGLQAALAAVEEQYGAAVVASPNGTASTPPAIIPTGSLALDHALGVGGIPRGRITEVYGPEGVGKTTLALSVIAQAQQAGGTAVFVDAEHALDLAWAQRVGVDTDTLLLCRPDSGEQALQVASLLIESGSVDVLAIDSVAALVPQA